jgi:Domain of unknown function (DUF1883)
MQFAYTDLGYRQQGEVVEVTLTSGANVRLMNSSNFSSYKSGGAYRGYGGLGKRSPLRLAIPDSDQWHVVVDMQGLRGSTRASVRVLSGSRP